MKKNLAFISQATAFPDSKSRHVLVKHKRGGWYLHPLVKHANPAKRRKGGYPLDPRGYYYAEGRWEVANGVIQISDELAMLTVAGIDHCFIPVDQSKEHACVPSKLVDGFLASACCSGQAPVVETPAPRKPSLPREAQALIAKAKHAEANADEWRRLGRKDKVREETLAAEGFLAQARRLIDDKVAKAAAKIAGAELKARLGNGTATGRERLDAMPKAKLLKVAKAVSLRNANDGDNFSKMSAQGLRLALLPGRAYTANGGIDWAGLLEAMDEVDGVASERRKAELAAEEQSNVDFAAYAAGQAEIEALTDEVYGGMSAAEVAWRSDNGEL